MLCLFLLEGRIAVSYPKTNRERIQQHCESLGLPVDCIEFYPQYDYIHPMEEPVCVGGFWSVYLANRPQPFTTNQDTHDRMDIDDEVSILLARLTEHANAL